MAICSHLHSSISASLVARDCHRHEHHRQCCYHMHLFSSATIAGICRGFFPLVLRQRKEMLAFLRSLIVQESLRFRYETPERLM